MANGTIAFDTLSTSGQISGTAKSVDTDNIAHGCAKHTTMYNQDANSVKASFNQTSITDTSAGLFTTTFTSVFGNLHYISSGIVEHGATAARGTNGIGIHTQLNSSDALDNGDALATGSRSYLTKYGSSASSDGGVEDFGVVPIMNTGDLA
tara:strand:+ start:345 stop:797 length:453 start_codon:yes stop_codon:yes gene_type:complete